MVSQGLVNPIPLRFIPEIEPDQPTCNAQDNFRMANSTIVAELSPALESHRLTEEIEAAENEKPACQPIALSTLAKERLIVINRALENCVPKSARAADTIPKAANWE
jgi:hypothetical protein